MEALYRDYEPRGVRFLYVYKALAHPELNGYVRPVTLEERLMHVAEAKRALGTEIVWLPTVTDPSPITPSTRFMDGDPMNAATNTLAGLV